MIKNRKARVGSEEKIFTAFEMRQKNTKHELDSEKKRRVILRFVCYLFRYNKNTKVRLDLNYTVEVFVYQNILYSAYAFVEKWGINTKTYNDTSFLHKLIDYLTYLYKFINNSK